MFVSLSIVKEYYYKEILQVFLFAVMDYETSFEPDYSDEPVTTTGDEHDVATEDEQVTSRDEQGSTTAHDLSASEFILLDQTGSFDSQDSEDN